MPALQPIAAPLQFWTTAWRTWQDMLGVCCLGIDVVQAPISVAASLLLLLISYMLWTNLPVDLVGGCLSCAFWFCTKSNVPPVHLEWILILPLYPKLSMLAFWF